MERWHQTRKLREGTLQVRAPVPRHLTADPLADPTDEPNRGDPTNGRHEREGRQLSSMSHPKPDCPKTAPLLTEMISTGRGGSLPRRQCLELQFRDDNLPLVAAHQPLVLRLRILLPAHRNRDHAALQEAGMLRRPVALGQTADRDAVRIRKPPPFAPLLEPDVTAGREPPDRRKLGIAIPQPARERQIDLAQLERLVVPSCSGTCQGARRPVAGSGTLDHQASRRRGVARRHGDISVRPCRARVIAT